MSAYVYPSRFLSLCPRIWIEHGILRIRTNLMAQLLSLFSICREVRFHKTARTVEIQCRSWWLLHRHRQIRFDDIARIIYLATGVPTSFAWLIGTIDEWECYSVGLKLTSGEHVHLFRFAGEDAVDTGWWGVLWGDDVLDLTGTQYEESRGLIDLLCAMTGKTLT